LGLIDFMLTVLNEKDRNKKERGFFLSFSRKKANIMEKIDNLKREEER